MAALSSARIETHEPGLELFRSIGGSLIHLHGEGGEQHSRKAAGEWLARNGLRSQFILCSQICHDDWDESLQQPILRFTPDAVREDISADLHLLGCDVLDLVYLDDHAELDFKPVIDAMAAEIGAGRIMHVGLRNYRPDRLAAVCAYARTVLPNGIEAMVTTELALPIASSPLWPEYVPFDSDIAAIVQNEALVVVAHGGDLTNGMCLFGGEDPSTYLRPHWIERWPAGQNERIVQDVLSRAARFAATPRAVLLAWMLTRPFPVVPVVGIPELLEYTTELVDAVNLSKEIWSFQMVTLRSEHPSDGPLPLATE